MIPEDKIQKICSEYCIGNYVSVNRIPQGVLNDNYVIETSTGKYFIKSVREKVKDKLKTIFEVESLMKSRGIPAVAMLKTKSGDIAIVSKKEVYSLYPFIEGDKNGKYLALDYKNMGEMLAKIHLAGRDNISDVPGLKQFKRPADEVVLEKLKGHRDQIINNSNQDGMDEQFLDYIDFKLLTAPKVKSSELPNDTLIHGDYHPENLLLDKNSRKIIGVCDWEKSEFGPRAYELARSLLYSCFSDGYKLDQALTDSKSFCEGYLSVYPMKKEEIMDGLKMRIHRMVLSSWLEEKYYKEKDSRANHFVGHEMGLLEETIKRKLLEKIDEIIS